MFRRLKDKLAEEVKQSPARFQEIINSAQAAVSSASSSNSEENASQNENSSSANENFFSLTEDDTPQNSPMKTVPLNNSSTPNAGKAVSVDLHTPSAHNSSSSHTFPINNGTSRTRRLSNSSMASDVSFRLPHYDSQPVYHLQSDWESASEAEDSGVTSTGAQLEQISKEQIYQAYRNSLDKYQKYRGRFTELAKKYRELEKDNAKARQVLVETQDKALRRISELREQCQLEQQAKAHLESALRLEMDDLQCVNQTLKTKLELVGENAENVLNGSSSKEESLINLLGDADVDTSSAESNLVVKRLEDELKGWREKFNEESLRNEKTVADLKDQLEKAQEEVSGLKKREEEGTILMAENKQMIHSELEKKETEVKNLKERISGLEENESAITTELKTLKEKFNKQAQDMETVAKDKLKLEDRLKEVFEEKKTVNNELMEMKEKIEKVNKKFKELSEDKTSLQSQNEQLSVEIKKCKEEMNELQKQKTLLTEEIKSIKIVNESSESQALTALQGRMKITAAEFETRISDLSRELNKKIEEKTAEIDNLTANNAEMSEKLSELESEKANLLDECETCRAKVDLLKKEKNDYEKTLEREIHEKNELKTQVANILQEIRRLEEQLREVRSSHSSIQAEKQKLEEKVEKVQRQHNEAKSKLEKDHSHKLQTKMKELEAKLHEVECENSQLAEKNCLLEESSRRNSDEMKRLQSNLTGSQDCLREENNRLVESVKEMEERVKTLTDQLTQCTGDHEKLYDEKERLDHQYRSAQDAIEAKEKEKLCLTEDFTSLQAKVTQLEAEKANLTECCDNLRVVVENIKTENDAMMKTRDELQKSFDNMKAEFDKLSGIKEQMECLKKENKSLNAKNKSLAGELESIKKNNQKHLSELETSLRQNVDENSKIADQFQAIKLQNETLNATVIQLEADLTRSREEAVDMNGKIAKNIDNERIREDRIQELEKLLHESEIQIRTHQDLEVAISTTNRELESLNKDLLKKINDLENQINRQRDYQQIKEANIALNSQKSELMQKLQELNSQKTDLESKCQDYQRIKEENENLISQLKKAGDESTERIKSLESQTVQYQDYQEIKDQNYKFVKDNAELKKSSKELEEKMKSLENQVKTLEDVEHQKASLESNLKDLEKKLKESEEKLQETERKLQESELKNNEKLVSLEDLENKLKKSDKKLANLDEIQVKLKESEKKLENFRDLEQKLQESNEKLAQFVTEISSYKEMSSNFEALENDKSRLEKELESSRSIIKDLNKDFEYHQTEIEALKEEKASLINELEGFNTKLNSETELKSVSNKSSSEKFDALTIENAKLQETNRELLEKLENLEKSSERKISDLTQEIEELQESSLHVAQITAELNKLKNKYDDIVKEKPEINGSNVAPENNELNSMKLQKEELEGRLRKIMSEVEEVSNKNLFLEQKVENYLILEQSNERLRLTNEKLSRQLDETLVSMHHHEGIQANTEFEYLRNILFQYLSGHVNANGTTLVKVIAAVLKFTPQQTQLVLDKETQRHTLLGSINNLL